MITIFKVNMFNRNFFCFRYQQHYRDTIIIFYNQAVKLTLKKTGKIEDSTKE